MSIKKIVASAGLAAGAIAAMAGTASASPSASDLVDGVGTLAGAADFAGSTVVNTFADRLGLTGQVDQVIGG